MKGRRNRSEKECIDGLVASPHKVKRVAQSLCDFHVVAGVEGGLAPARRGEVTASGQSVWANVGPSLTAFARQLIQNYRNHHGAEVQRGLGLALAGKYM